MNKVVPILLLIVLVALVGLGVWYTKSRSSQKLPDTPRSALTQAQARGIAERTCIKGGKAQGLGTYNENSKTWWFEAHMNAEKPGCNPACVVSEETRTAEINWRCTGLAQPEATATATLAAAMTTPNKVCEWVDKSDVIVKVTIPEGVKKDTSYEAGFVYRTTPKSIEQRLVRLARGVCDYRTGFNKLELSKLKEARIGVWGYTDSKERTLKNAPILINFNSGMPKEGKVIEVGITD